MQKARKIMKYSNPALLIMFMPSKGRELSMSGSIAQCMAQAMEAAIPHASQLILAFIG